MLCTCSRICGYLRLKLDRRSTHTSIENAVVSVLSLLIFEPWWRSSSWRKMLYTSSSGLIGILDTILASHRTIHIIIKSKHELMHFFLLTFLFLNLTHIVFVFPALENSRRLIVCHAILDFGELLKIRRNSNSSLFATCELCFVLMDHWSTWHRKPLLQMIPKVLSYIIMWDVRFQNRIDCHLQPWDEQRTQISFGNTVHSWFLRAFQNSVSNHRSRLSAAFKS